MGQHDEIASDGSSATHSAPIASRRLHGRSTVILLILATTVWAPDAAVVLADGWTGFQGPMPRDADIHRLPIKWSPQEGVAWKAELLGYGQSSPVTWGERIFVTSISGAHKERGHIAAFNLASGKKLWQHDLDTVTRAENNNYISKAAPTPVSDESGLVCFFEGGNLIALTHDGQVRWQRNLVEQFGPIDSRHGLAASLEQNSDHVFVWIEREKDPYVLAIEKTTGKDTWKADGLGATSWASPRLIPMKSGSHLVLSGIGRLAGLDPATGKRLWQFDDIKGNSTPTPFPVSESRFLIGATVGRGETDSGKAAESNGLIAIRKKDDGTFHVEYVWKAKRATSSFGSPIAHQGYAYFVNASGVLFCLDLETGEEQFSNRLGDSNWATPIPIGERICFFGKGGTVSIVSTGSNFERVAENVTWEAAAAPEQAARGFGGPVLYAAVYTKDRLLLRRGDMLYCITGRP